MWNGFWSVFSWVMVLEREYSSVIVPGSAQLSRYHIISSERHAAWQQILSGQTLREGIYCLKDLAEFYGQFPELEAAVMRTHLSVPIILRDGTLYGSVNSVSKQEKEDCQVTVTRLVSLAKIIARYAEELLVIEQLKQDNYHLALHSYTDALTQLPNRRAIFDRLPALFSLAKRINRTVLISYIDLDEFKKINDDLGHDTGDELLKDIGQRLQHIVREEDIVGRIGGDEFLLACLGPEKRPPRNWQLPRLKTAFIPRCVGNIPLAICVYGMKAQVWGWSVSPRINVPWNMPLNWLTPRCIKRKKSAGGRLLTKKNG
ncbi:GGDEF domain-containing protein [Mangrovibacter sp. SLW1]